LGWRGDSGWLGSARFVFIPVQNLAIFDIMKPRSRRNALQQDLFKAQFSQILNPDHPLLMLAEKIN